MGYANDEKETTCVYDYENKVWIVYSCVPRHMNKLQKIAGEPFWKEEEPDKDDKPRLIAGKWRLKSSQVSFGKVRAKKTQSAAEVIDG